MPWVATRESAADGTNPSTYDLDLARGGVDFVADPLGDPHPQSALRWPDLAFSGHPPLASTGRA